MAGTGTSLTTRGCCTASSTIAFIFLPSTFHVTVIIGAGSVHPVGEQIRVQSIDIVTCDCRWRLLLTQGPSAAIAASVSTAQSISSTCRVSTVRTSLNLAREVTISSGFSASQRQKK